MELIREMNKEIKTRNWVAKAARDMAGAGAHDIKGGKKSKRAKQKREWKKEVHDK